MKLIETHLKLTYWFSVWTIWSDLLNLTYLQCLQNSVANGGNILTVNLMILIMNIEKLEFKMSKINLKNSYLI